MVKFSKHRLWVKMEVFVLFTNEKMWLRIKCKKIESATIIFIIN